MKVIGITGSSGSGKSTVAKIFEKKYDAKLVDADKIVKELTIPKTDYMYAIKNDIGEEFFQQDGNLNKKMLAEKIYSDEETLRKLNRLTFKYVVDEMKKRIFETEENVSFVVIDAPLLIEAGLDKLCDYIIAVLANKEIKIQRICKRDNLDEKTAESRLKIQREDKFYADVSNFVIYNNGKEKLENEIEKIIENIVKKGKK